MLPDLFKQIGKSEEEIDRKIAEAFHTIFEDEEERFYFEMGGDKGYMLDTGNLDARTEGMSYGMMMAVQMNFYSDAYRVAMNIGLDAAWCGKTPELTQIADNPQRFFSEKTEYLKYDSYLLDGTPVAPEAMHPTPSWPRWPPHRWRQRASTG